MGLVRLWELFQVKVCFRWVCLFEGNFVLRGSQKEYSDDFCRCSLLFGEMQLLVVLASQVFS